MLWLWHRLAAVASIRPLAWEPPPYAVGAALKSKKPPPPTTTKRHKKEGYRLGIIREVHFGNLMYSTVTIAVLDLS